jgi:membrane associated rhomboid family serine protease
METCYRHPGRETGVSCSNCGRPICPDCMTNTPVGMRCPECARQRTRVRTMRTVEEPTATYVLIAINVLVALGLILGGSTGGEFGNNTIYDLGAVSRDTVADGEWWRLVTNGFIHGAGYPNSVFLHLGFNMLALWVLGGILEPAVGRLRFLLIYFTSLLAGSLGTLLLSPDGFSAGASGAVFGMMGAGLLVMRRRGISPMESGLGLWLVLNLIITFTIPNISIGGHLGGLAGGLVATFLLVDLPERVRSAPAALPIALCAVLALGSVAASIAVSAG